MLVESNGNASVSRASSRIALDSRPGAERSGRVSIAIALMCALAVLAIELAARTHAPFALAIAVLTTLAGYLLAPVVAGIAQAWKVHLTVLALLAFAIGLYRHGFEPDGRVAALDVLLLGAAGAVMPVLLAYSWLARNAALLAVLSAFATIVSTSYSDGDHALLVALAYCGVGVLWLIGQASRPGSLQATRLAAMMAVVVVVIGGLGGMLAGRAVSVYAVSGFARGSGGEGEGSATARRGVGDGPDEVAGDNAASTGFDQTDRFSTSAQDSLYDLWTQSYGEPLLSHQHDKMIGLRPDEARIVDATDESDLRSGRRFELRRQPRQRESTTRPDTPPLLFVEGLTPLHIRLTTFDRFDGSAWIESSPRRLEASIRLIEEYGAGYFTLVDHPDATGFARLKRHRIKVAGLANDMLPLPPAPRGFRLGRVDRANFFVESRGGLLGVRRQSLPGGSVIDSVSHSFDSRARTDAQLVTSRSGRWRLDSKIDPDVFDLAQGWIDNTEPGWSQIDAIVLAMHSHVVYSPGATISAEGDMLRAFLIDLRRGDDYHFAHALATILDSLGYRVRLASGFYASPDAFDVRLQNTPVYASDTHTWVEVRLRSGAWYPIEATPDHALISPRQTIGDALASLASKAFAWMKANAIASVAVLLACMAIFLSRRAIFDQIDYLAWHLRRSRSPAETVRRTTMLLERVWARRAPPRRSHETVGRWLARFDHQSTQQLARLHDWATFGPHAPVPVDDVMTVCSDAIRWLYQQRRSGSLRSQGKVNS